MPGAAIAVHTFGDFQQFNPHLHIIATDGCFSGDGTFFMFPSSAQNNLSRYVHKMLVDYRTAVHTDLRMSDFGSLACPISLITDRSSSRVPPAISRLLGLHPIDTDPDPDPDTDTDTYFDPDPRIN